MKMNFFTVAALALCLGFTACSDDEPELNGGNENGTEVENVAVKDANFRAYLHAQNYHFNEAGELIQDDKVLSTIALDLSGLKMNDLSDIKLFPNVNYIDLSDNGYGPVFDFTILPEQITGVDLTGNEISEYKNLIKFEVAENGEETITNLRDLKTLYLPEAAKYNMTDLVRYFRQNGKAIADGTIDMQMEDEKGKLAKYNTLRTIADPVLAAHLNGKFGSIFTDGKLDLSKRMSADENVNTLVLNPYLTENFDKLENFDGVQYIINNPYWIGTTITVQPTSVKEFPAVKIPKTVTSLYLKNLNIKSLDLSGAESLAKISFTEINGVETFDLRGSKVWGQRDFTVESKSGTKLSLLGCKDLKTVIFPEAKVLRVHTLNLEGLPALETCDITKFSFILNFTIGNLPASYKVVYPNITEFKAVPEDGINFGCSNSTYALQATKDFIEKYKNYNGGRMIYGNELSYDTKDQAFWR